MELGGALGGWVFGGEVMKFDVGVGFGSRGRVAEDFELVLKCRGFEDTIFVFSCFIKRYLEIARPSCYHVV